MIVTRRLARWRPSICRAQVFYLLLVGVPLVLWTGASRYPGSLEPASVEPAVRVPSEVTWTDNTLALISRGEPFRGLLIARRCNHCHGQEGFSSVSETPNLAGIDRFSLWKQLQDFRTGKRSSATMEPIARALSARATADVAAYFSMLPTVADPQDKRAFPVAESDASAVSLALPLATLGNAQRGIPPARRAMGQWATSPVLPC